MSTLSPCAFSSERRLLSCRPGKCRRVPARPGQFLDISLGDEGFEIFTPFSLPLFQRMFIAVLPARRVPARPGQYVKTFAAALRRSQRLQKCLQPFANFRMMSGFWTSQVPLLEPSS